MPRQPFSRLNLEGQLERVYEFGEQLSKPEDLRMTRILLKDFYWVTKHQEVRDRIQYIAEKHGDKQLIEMLDKTKRKLPWKNNGARVYTSNEPNWVPPYD